jgi:hypothetical protein
MSHGQMRISAHHFLRLPTRHFLQGKQRPAK